MKIYKLCKSYFVKHKRGLATYLIITIFVGLFSMINPFLIGDFIDSLIEGGSMAVVYRFVIIFATINILRMFFSYITMIIYTKVQSKIAHEFSQSIIKHIQSVSLSFIHKKDTDYLAQVINGDTNSIIIFCISFASNFILNIIYLIAPLIILLYINSFITIILISFICLYVFIYVKFKKPLYRRNLALREVQNTFFSGLLEQLRLTKFIKMNAIGKIFYERINAKFENLINKTLSMQKLSYAYSALDNIITTITQISLFLLGGFFILSGNFTIGSFTIFSMYFNMMLSSAKYFFDFGQSYQDAMVSYNRITDILFTKTETIGKTRVLKIESIAIKHLSFSYEASDKKIINNFNYIFKKDNIYCVVGKNGAGKSTLIDILMGMYIDEIGGEIFINNISTKMINMPELRKKHIALSEQQSIVFEVANYNKTDKELINLLKLEDVFEKTNFSGGEKQKLSLYKALTKNADVIIFDEPTLALDKESSLAFIDTLKKLKHKIVIIVSHDEQVIENCDEIIKLS